MSDILSVLGVVVIAAAVFVFMLTRRNAGGKAEYARFVVIAACLWWVLSMAYECVYEPFSLAARHWPPADEFSLIILLPWFAVAHQLFPFRKVKRSRVVSLCLWGATAVVAMAVTAVWLLVQSSDM